ncbi:MAG TPA: superoxide dismutase family protein [Phycisphaerae bacterium]|nr:superoxide dismutase family protein [Phycisphaerae bacterium]
MTARLTARRFLLAATCTLAAAAWGGCQTGGSAGHETASGQGMGMGKKDKGMMMDHSMMWGNVDHAVAVIYPTKGNSVSGTINFVTMGKGVHIHGTITGLAPNSTHAIHIHEYGDQSSDDGTAAGGHYNPEGHTHGAPTAEMHHAGDLGNITADGSGTATIDMMDNGISIAGMKDPIIGRGVVIHAKPDDFSQPVGNAGGRIGVGVIGIAKSSSPAATMPMGGMMH